MYIILAAILGLTINFFTGGFDFNPLLCFLAGIFLIMPALLKFKIEELKDIKNDKKYILINILFNFILNPIIFVSIGFLIFGVDKILFAFLFLGLISGGGMLFSNITKNNGNIKLGFSLFFINMIIFTILFFPLNNIFEKNKIIIEPISENNLFININKQETFRCPVTGREISINDEAGIEECALASLTGGKVNCFGNEMNISPIAFLIVLIIIPFILSRIILSSNKLTNILLPRISNISLVATFFIILYIFTLKEINLIFQVPILTIFKGLIAIILSYSLVYLFSYLIYKKLGEKDIDKNKALFFNITTRFLTMGMVFSFIYSTMFGVNFILVFAIAYFVQVIFSFLVTKYIIKKD